MLKEIRLTNFKSFLGEHRLSFPSGSNGIFMVVAENKVESKLGSNGGGKSSLLCDSVAFCLYGRTMRGARAKNVSPWNSPGKTKVECDIILRNKIVTISRGWRPNFLRIIEDGHKTEVTQGQLDSYLGLNFPAFCQSVVWGQFNPMFLDLSSTEKLELFSNVLNLDYWLEKSNKALSESIILKEGMRLARDRSFFLKGKLQSIDSELERNKRLSEGFESEVSRKIQELYEDIDLLGKDHEDTLEKLSRIGESLTSLKDEISSTEGSMKEDLGTYKSLVEDRDSVNNRLKELDFHIAAHKKELKKLENISDSCPYCGQSVEEEYLDDKRSQIHGTINDETSTRNSILSEFESLQAKVGEYEKRLDSKEDLISEKKRMVNSLEHKAEILKMSLDKILNNIDYKVKAAKVESKRPNPYIEAMNSLMLKKEKAENELSRISKDLEGKESLHDSMRHWVKGFKQIRLFQIEELLSVFKAQVNSNLIQLGLEDWGVEFDIERESSTGSVVKGFHLLVKNPQSPEPVPIESWSGGEYQRLRIAVNMGLSHLISERTGIVMDKLIVDEPTTHLNSQGIVDLLDSLSSIPDKQIWVIDHHSLDWGGFSGYLKLVKDSDGSRIEEFSYRSQD